MARPGPAAVYEYRDAAGRLLYAVERFAPKRFRVVTPTGRPLLQGDRYRRVPYRLPDLLAADPARTIFVVEGEKDADRLWAVGLPATCNAFGGGKGKWTRGHSAPLRGRDVAILPDNDRTGEEHAESVARGLIRVAATVRICRLPDLPRKGDVSDWLDAGGTPERLRELVAATPEWSTRPSVQLSHDESDLIGAAYRRERILNSDHSTQEKLLLIVLSEDLRTPPTQRDLAHCLSLSERRVRQLIDRLRRVGVIRVTRVGRTVRYHVSLIR
jgi:DNA primase